MRKIKTVKHIINEKTGETKDGEVVFERVDRVEYEFAESVSDDAKKAVREHVPTLRNKSEIEKIIESVDG